MRTGCCNNTKVATVVTWWQWKQNWFEMKFYELNGVSLGQLNWWQY